MSYSTPEDATATASACTSRRSRRRPIFTLRYTSYNGPGTTTIRAYGTTLCGQQVEATATLTINP